MVRLKDIIERIKKISGYNQTTVASDIFGISVENLANKIRRNTIDTNLIVRFAVEKGYDLNWLLTGSGEPLLKNNNGIDSNKSESSNAIELQYINLVREFIDKERALNINHELIELERLNPETFKRVESYIKGTVDMAREMARTPPPHVDDRRREQRRVHNKVDQIPNNRDRRSGTDRRKAGVKR